MSCNLNEIMNDSMDELREVVQGKAASIDVGQDYATFNWGGDFKVKRRDQAVKAANNKKLAVEAWAKKKFGEKFEKGWVRVTETDTRVMLDYGFPKNLKEAYQVKIEQDSEQTDFSNTAQQANEQVVDGEVVPFDDNIFGNQMPTPARNTLQEDITKIDFDDYIKHKKGLVKSMARKLSDLYQEAKTNKTDALKEEIDRVQNIKLRFEEEIMDLETSVNPLEDTFQIFEADIDLVEYLIQGENPPIQQLYEAEDIMAYLMNATNTSNDNKYNRFILDDASEISTELEDKLHDLSKTFNFLNGVIYKAKKEYLLNIIDESPKLRGMFPDKELADIREELLADAEGASFIDAFFMPTGKQTKGNDSLLAQMIRMEVDKKRGEAKNLASRYIGKLIDMTPKINKILASKGYDLVWTPLKGTMFSNYSYKIFEQFDEFGNPTSRLISKFSARWQTQLSNKMAELGERLGEAIGEGDRGEQNKIHAQKFNWINENANFFDITRVPEIIGDDKFKGWKARFNDAEAEAYKAEVIAQIGIHEYNKLVEQQIDMLDQYRIKMKNLIGDIYAGEGVTEWDKLSYEGQYKIKVLTAVHDPFSVLDSKEHNQGGLVDVHHGNNSDQYQSQVKYNSYFPKQEVTRYDTDKQENITTQGEYYDNRFDEVANDDDLYDYWNLLNDSAEFVNMSIADGRTKLHTNSLPQLGKSIIDVLLDRNLEWSERAMILRQNTVDFIKDAFSAQVEKVDRGDEINKGELGNTIQSKVNNQIRIGKLKLDRIREDGLGVKDKVIDLSQESPEVINFFKELLQLPNTADSADVMAKIGVNVNVHDVMKSYYTAQVMKEQTMNLPVIMRAYLDMAAEYRARKEAHPRVRLMKDLYNGIRDKKSTKQVDFNKQNSIGNAMEYFQQMKGLSFSRNRNLSKMKMDDFYRRNILATSDTETWLEFTWLGKNYNKGEKGLKTELEFRIADLKEKSKIASDIGDEQAVMELDEMRDKFERELENLGKTYTAAAFYHTVINRYSIFKGLAWNPKAATINAFQGWFQGVINDTGKYWTKGNFHQAYGFTRKRVLGKVNKKSEYAKQIEIAEILIQTLNILQDATNEIDRAKNDSGATGASKKMQPFYLTELVEWYNQTPEVLSILMDKRIVNIATGESMPVFDGKTFPAYDVVGGKLVLKPDYRSPENVANWENFETPEFRDLKGKISATISVLNGDYSKTGTTMIKSFVLGKTFTMFKTWLSMQIWQRFAYKQTDLELGIKDYDGFYTGSMKSGKTRGIASAAGILAIGAATLTTLPAAMGIAGIAGLSVYIGQRLIRNNNRTATDEIVEDAMYGRQLLAAVRSIISKAYAIPINSIGGKARIKEYDFDDLDLSKEEKENIHTLMNEFTIIMGGVAMKAMLAALFTGDEEEEPMTVNGDRDKPNKFRKSEGEKAKRKVFANLIENYSTRIIDDITLYYNPHAAYNTLKVDGVGRLMEQTTAMIMAIYQGDGDKFDKNMKGATLPSVVRGWGGFKPLTEMEYENNELLDQIFKSDLKKEMNDLRKKRSNITEEMTEDLREQYNYDDLSPAAQLKVDARIKKRIKKAKEKLLRTPDRRLFDEDQNRIK